jgi:hypothetical protein
MKIPMGSRCIGRRALIGLHLLACATAAFGQEPQLNLAEIRKNNFPTIDRQRVQDWCQQRIRQLLASKEPLKEVPAFLTEVNQHLQAPDATAAFKTGMIEAMAVTFAAEYKPATTRPANNRKDSDPSLGAVILLAFIKARETPAALPCYKLAIKDAAPGLRLIAAEGLLKSKLSAQDWDALLPDVQKQAAVETDPATLDRLYRLLTASGGPAQDKAVSALMAILDARLIRFEQKGEFPALADTTATAWLAGKIAQIPNNQTKNEIVRRTARLLADAVYHFTQTEAGRDQQQTLERVIVMTETQLKAMVKALAPDAATQPNVTAAMAAGGTDRNTKIETELAKWIGTAQTPGVLNAAPFSFERGLAIKRPAPAGGPAATTSTSPAR